MSARPSIPRLEGEELDLLISRSLDGDLSPEESRDLETVLANDAAARARMEALAGLVAEARALPAPAPPFALSTRVNSNVSEKAARGGSIFHRFGFYPPPGMAIGAMVVMGVVAVAITVMNPPRPVASILAERNDGPVDVFFQESARAPGAARTEARKAKDATTEAGKAGAKQVASAPSESAASAVTAVDDVVARVDSKEKAREEGMASRLAEKKDASVPSVSPPAAPNEIALDEKQNKLAKREAEADADTGARRIRQASADSPALSAAAPQAAGAIAPAAPAPASPPARALKSVEPRSWSVVVRGEGARRWMLRRAPEGRPATAAPASSFRVTLSPEGRVTAVRPLDARAVHPALLEFVRGLVFAPVGSALGGATAGIAEGFARDREQKPKDERSETLADKNADRPAENPAEIEVEVSTH
ncbi:MAG: hypothetical protein ABI584_15170 [Acidobacteriota bacterium]